jgi:hypothetical protein
LGKHEANQLLLVAPAEFFHDALSGAIKQLKINASEHATSYLVGLLTKFLTTEKLFLQLDGQKVDTLVTHLSVALEEDNVEIKRERLKHMGDYALYIAGFFSDSLTRKLVDVDYYIGMGGSAYGAVAQLQNGRSDGHLFQELSGKFPQFVDALSQVSEVSSFPRDSNNLLRTYDLWTKTGSERLAKQLAKAGIVMSRGKKEEAS